MSAAEQDDEGLRRTIAAMTLVARLGTRLGLNPDAITPDSVEFSIIKVLEEHERMRRVLIKVRQYCPADPDITEHWQQAWNEVVALT